METFSALLTLCGDRHFKWHQGSMESQGIYHGFPWKSGVTKSNVIKFHGICPRTIRSPNLILQSSMKFHGTRRMPFQLTFKFPWNFMEPPLWPREILWNSIEFHGTFGGELYGIPWSPWNCKILILINFIIRELYFTIYCMISCFHISDNPLLVKILRYLSFFGAPHFT